MIHHLVMMKFKPDIDEEQVEALEALLDDLPNKIVEIHLYEFGRDLLHSERSYDFGLSALFANLEALQRYQEHPAHLVVREKVRAICEDVITVDFHGSQAADGLSAQVPWEKEPFDRIRF